MICYIEWQDRKMFLDILLCFFMITNINCDISTGAYKVLTTEELEQDGWRMVFRGISGNGNSAFNAWTAGTLTSPDKPLSLKRTNGYHFRDIIINNWSSLGIKLVKFAFYDTDREVAYVIFNGIGSNLNSWFDRTRVIDSSWPDLTSTSVYNIFSINGHYISQKADRRFYINRNYGGCPNDRGHLVVLDTQQPNPPCLYDDQPSYPAFIYSKYNSVDLYQRRLFGIADFLVIFIKM